MPELASPPPPPGVPKDVHRAGRAPRSRYVPPADIAEVTLSELVDGARTIDVEQQRRLFVADREGGRTSKVYCAGDIKLLHGRCVAIVGSRKVSPEGGRRAERLARELASRGVVVVSGLAEGVDVHAHRATLEAGGRTVAVIGTPLDRVYPAAHASLQETIYREHLLVSQFPAGSQVFPSNFPQRNKLMAAATDATAIIEASDTSGSLHQASECTRLGRWLFIARSVLDNPKLTWPGQFKSYPRMRPLDDTNELIEAIIS